MTGGPLECAACNGNHPTSAACCYLCDIKAHICGLCGKQVERDAYECAQCSAIMEDYPG